MGSEWIFGSWPWGGGGVNWIRLAQDRDRWRAVVSAVMNLRVLAPRSYNYKSTMLLPETKHTINVNVLHCHTCLHVLSNLELSTCPSHVCLYLPHVNAVRFREEYLDLRGMR
jgi:hypothetical protein